MATELLDGNQYIVGRTALRAEAMQGMNGGKNPSAIQANGLDFQGKPLQRGTVAKSIIAADGSVNAASAVNSQTRELTGKNVKAHPFMKGAAPGGKIPSVLDRGGGQRAALTSVMARQGRK